MDLGHFAPRCIGLCASLRSCSSAVSLRCFARMTDKTDPMSVSSAASRQPLSDSVRDVRGLASWNGESHPQFPPSCVSTYPSGDPWVRNPMCGPTYPSGVPLDSRPMSDTTFPSGVPSASHDTSVHTRIDLVCVHATRRASVRSPGGSAIKRYGVTLCDVT